MNPVSHTGRPAALGGPAIFATDSANSSTVYTRRLSGPDRPRLDATGKAADQRRAAAGRPGAGHRDYPVTAANRVPGELPATRSPTLSVPLVTDPGRQ